MNAHAQTLINVATICNNCNNPRIAPFAMEIMNHADCNVREVTDFFGYWDNFDSRYGEWCHDEMIFSYDCPINEPTEGILFDMATIVPQFEEWIKTQYIDYLQGLVDDLRK